MSETRPPDIRSLTLADNGVSVTLLNLGCITQDWRVPVAGRPVSVIAGYASPAHYLIDPYFTGQIVGPVANRISGAAFELNGQTHHLDANDPPHHLHGGAQGTGTRIWEMDRDGPRAADLHLSSPHGVTGYPGSVTFHARISLDGPRLTYDLTAQTDRPTPVNLAQHNYYTLGCSGGYRARIDADTYLETGPDLIPTGRHCDVTGTQLDFRQPRLLDPSIPVDATLALTAPTSHPSVAVTAPNGLALQMWSDQPGLQLFTGATFAHKPDLARAFCLEPQQFPDSPNHPDFPSIIITPDRPYRQTLIVEIAAQ